MGRARQSAIALLALLSCSCTIQGFHVRPLTSPISITSSISGLGVRRPLATREVNGAVFGASIVGRRSTHLRMAAESFDCPQDYDVFLGTLIFSSNDPAYDIAENFDKASDDKFREWLAAKVKATTDLEERVGLSSLLDIIDKVVKKIQDQQALAPMGVVEDATFTTVESDTSSGGNQTIRSNADIFRDLRTLQNAGPGGEEDVAFGATAAPKSVWDDIPESVRQSYEQTLKTLVERPQEVSLTEAVEAAYTKCDIQFLALLKKKIENATDVSEKRALEMVSDEIGEAMSRRMMAASEKLRSLLTAGNAVAIERAAAALARKAGGVDDALIMLLEGNIDQAEKAGPQGAGAAKMMRRIKEVVTTELDKKMEPNKRLLRQCLRANSMEEMEVFLKEAFRPRAKLFGADGKETSEEPLVAPPDFIDAVRALQLNFGNVGVEEVEFASKVDLVIAAAEKVATELYGENQSAKEQQDRAWRDHGKSVWELEDLEDKAMMEGEEVPWANDKYDHMLPQLMKGEKKGTFKIGGS